MDYQATVDYLYTSLPMFQRDGRAAFKKDLAATIRLLRILGNPHSRIKTIHVAGTNGKGSTAHMLAGILQKAGYKTGLYTSPHLKSFTERIKINGRNIKETGVVEFVNRIKPYIDEIKPSFFEITVAMAFDYFFRENVDIAVIETGMGGRLDSTNVIIPEISIVTSIGYDHQEFLGDTLFKIAMEKAGIFKKNIPAIVSEYQSITAGAFIEAAEYTGCRLSFADKSIKVTYSGSRVDFRENDRCIYRMDPERPHYLTRNIPTVLNAIEVLNRKGLRINRKAVNRGLEAFESLTGLRGRWQVLTKKPLTICDIAHNEGGIKLVMEELKKLSHNRLHIVWGMVKEKDIENIFHLLPSSALYYFCKPNLPRGMPSSKLFEKAKQNNMQAVDAGTVNNAIARARKNARDTDLIFIGGSTFVVAEIEDGSE